MEQRRGHLHPKDCLPASHRPPAHTVALQLWLFASLWTLEQRDVQLTMANRFSAATAASKNPAAGNSLHLCNVPDNSNNNNNDDNNQNHHNHNAKSKSLHLLSFINHYFDRYLEDVTLGQLKSATGYVDAFARLHLDAVHTLVAVAVVHGVVWRQEHPLVVGDGGAALSCMEGRRGRVWRKHSTYK